MLVASSAEQRGERAEEIGGGGEAARLATAGVKCLMLWVSSQSGLLAMADRSTGTSASWRIKSRFVRTSGGLGYGTSSPHSKNACPTAGAASGPRSLRGTL